MYQRNVPNSISFIRALSLPTFLIDLFLSIIIFRGNFFSKTSSIIFIVITRVDIGDFLYKLSKLIAHKISVTI